MSIGGADLSVQGRIEINLIAHGIDAAANSLKGLQTQAERAGGSLGTAGAGLAGFGAKASSLGKTLAVGVTAPLIGLGALTVSAASDLAESMSAVNTLFGDSAAAVVAYSETSAEALGLSQQATLQAATQFGALFEATGSTATQAADFSQSMITASADLASFYNVAGGAAAVSDQLRAALTGEGDALKQYGIIINESSVQQELARTGQDKLTGSALEAAKVQARYNLILAQMGAAQGDQARTSDQLAGKTRTAKAQLADMSATIGTQLLPLVLRATTELSKLVAHFQTMPSGVQTAILVLAGVAAVIGPLLVALGAVIAIAPAVGAAFTLMLGPVGLVILAIAALAYIFGTNMFGIRDLTMDAVGGIVDAFSQLVDWFTGDGLGNALSAVGDFATKLVGYGETALKYYLFWPYYLGKALYGPIQDLLAKVVGLFAEFGPGIIAAVTGFFPMFYNLGRDVVSGIWTGITSLGGWLWEQVKGFVKSNIVDAADAILHFGSPSKTMAAIGRDVSRGLAIGMKEAMPLVATATQQLTTTVVGAAAPPPRLAPAMTAPRTVQAGGVTINVSGAGDPEAVASAVYRQLDAAFGRLELEARR